ncbi:hypothetical protein ES702_06130 [subsurface metagenome]
MFAREFASDTPDCRSLCRGDMLFPALFAKKLWELEA